MANYTANGGNTALSTSYKTALEITGGTGVRPKLYALILSCITPADNVLKYLLQRTTGAGTGTAVTPKPVDPADPASEVTAKKDDSGEPTYTSGEEILGPLGQHRRGQLAWQAYDDNARIVVPATSGAGIGLQMKHASETPETSCHFAWSE